MANDIGFEALLTALVDIAASAASGIVIDNRKMADSEAEYIPLLISQDEENAVIDGWIFFLAEIPDQVGDGCERVITYSFGAVKAQEYQARPPDNVNSEIAFWRDFEAVNNALNSEQNLGLSNLVLHSGLRSVTPVELFDYTKNDINRSVYLGGFEIPVTVILHY
jgi:hypothetical protein